MIRSKQNKLQEEQQQKRLSEHSTDSEAQRRAKEKWLGRLTLFGQQTIYGSCLANFSNFIRFVCSSHLHHLQLIQLYLSQVMIHNIVLEDKFTHLWIWNNFTNLHVLPGNIMKYHEIFHTSTLPEFRVLSVAIWNASDMHCNQNCGWNATAFNFSSQYRVFWTCSSCSSSLYKLSARGDFWNWFSLNDYTLDAIWAPTLITPIQIIASFEHSQKVDRNPSSGKKRRIAWQKSTRTTRLCF